MQETAKPVTTDTTSRRRRWIVGTLATLVIASAGVAIVLYFYAASLIERRLRPATIELLARRFDSEVELSRLAITFTPTLSIRGEGLTLRHKARRDIPPVITIRAFTIASSISQLWSRHTDRVHLEGLEIMIPPRRGKDMPALGRSANGRGDNRPDVYIHELLTEDSLLTIMPKREGKRPRVFQLRRLRFTDLEFSKQTPFEAAITNPTPEGEIAVVGAFGPWNGEEPSLTPIEGSFLFDADLASIKGIGGALHAEGTFGGPLEYIRTSGKTHTEGFHLSSGGAKFPLFVFYEAIVDATNGDTTLDTVEGTLGQSKISARGEITGVEGVPGRRITLDTTARDGRLEDFVKLTTRVQNSPMTGLVNVRATLDIPPGDAEVIDRMDLDGTFDVRSARFTSRAIQDRVDELSRRGRGRPKDETIDDVASNLRGSFRLRHALMAVRSLTFQVRGANVRLAGSYGVKSERLDFRGTLRLQARASQTQTGWKSLVLKVFDPLLDGEGAGTILPITITGTRGQPRFGVELKKLLPGRKPAPRS